MQRCSWRRKPAKTRVVLILPRYFYKMFGNCVADISFYQILVPLLATLKLYCMAVYLFLREVLCGIQAYYNTASL
jgi:hypothetical protein